VTVSVVPNDPPLGAAINTLGDDGTITIAGTSYGGGTTGLSYVLLERTTRAVVASGTVAIDTTGAAQLASLADQYGSGGNYMRYLMIVSGRNGLATKGSPLLESPMAAFAGFLKKIGAALPSVENFLALQVGLPFSVIGIPGAPAGAATTRIPGGYADPVSGAITGYLTKNQAIDAAGTPLYDYNAGRQPNFDTKAAGSSGTTNRMTIDGRTYAATLPGTATAGFHVVVLESLTLRELSNEALPTNGLGNDRNTQKEAAEKLVKAIEKGGGPTVFVQTIGKPKGAGPEWQGVVDAFSYLGANLLEINALDGGNEFALVARRGAKSPPAESSTAADSGKWGRPTYPPARLVGTLVRSRTSNYVPNVYSTPSPANPDGTVNLQMMNLAYQAPTAWPDLGRLPGVGSADEATAAAKYLCEELNFCQSTNSCPSVRECFWQRYESDWNAKFTKLSQAGLFRPGKGFTEPTLEAVRKELADETEAVTNVKRYLEKLQQPFETSQTESYVDLKGISDQIWGSLQQGAPSDTTSWALGLVGKVAALGGFFGPPTSAAAAGLSAAFGLASYLSKKDGAPILGSEVKARSDALAQEMLSRLGAAAKTIEGLGKLYVSDYGKLMTAYRQVDSGWALPGRTQAVGALRISTKQWFWETLLPTAYPDLIRAANQNNARHLDCKLGSDRGAWPNQPDEYQMNATVGYRADGSPINGVSFFTRGVGGKLTASPLIGDEVFKPLAEGGLGMEKLQLFTPRVFGQIFHAVDHTSVCQVGFLPQEW